MKSDIRFLSLALTLGAFTFLSGCYTQLATVHNDNDDGDRGGTYRQQYDGQDSSQASSSMDSESYYDQPRYHVGFQYYYPWCASTYWGYNYDPWWGGFYDPWYYNTWYYSPWRFSAYNYWHAPYYGGGFYPGYYAYYQPYVVQNRSSYVQRGSGYSRTGGVRDGYSRTGTYGSAAGSLPAASRYGTSRSSSASGSSAVPQRNRSTEAGATRSSTGASRSSVASPGRSSSPPSRGTSGSTGQSTRRSGATRGHDQSSSSPSPSYSPPQSSSGSREGSSGGGSNRSSGGRRGNR